MSRKTRKLIRRKNPKGGYYPCWYFYHKGVLVSTGTDVEEDAEAFKNDFLLAAWQKEKLGIEPPKPVPLWRDGVVKWFDEKSRKKSIVDDKLKVKWLDQFLRDKRFDEITRDFVHQIMLSRGVDPEDAIPANSTANRHVAIISAICNAAEKEWNWNVKAPKFRMYDEPPPRDICYTPEQVLRFKQEAPLHQGRIALFACSTLFRKSNIVELEWSMIDFEKRAVQVKGEFTKSGKPIYVPLNNTAMNVIMECYNDPIRHLKYVFHYEGKPIFHVTTRAWHNAIKRAGLEAGGTLHTMRHCGNSWLAQRGVPKEIRARLGGWSTKDVIDGYTHLYIEHLRPYSNLIDEMFNHAITVQSNGDKTIQSA